jgi:hypothetical protein
MCRNYRTGRDHPACDAVLRHAPEASKLEQEVARERDLRATRKLAEALKERAEEAEAREKEQKIAAEKLGQAAIKLRRRAIAATGAAVAALVLLP